MRARSSWSLCQEGKRNFRYACTCILWTSQKKQSLHLGGWDYTDQVGHHRLVTEQNRMALIEHLREHYVDSPWGLPWALPRGTHDAQGAMTVPPNTDHFDAWIELWPDAAQYMVFAKVGTQFESWAMGTPEFTTAVKAWVTFWAAHVETKGLQPEQLAAAAGG